MRIIGHRGAAGLVPENTLPSFQKALDLEVDGIELDVHWVHDRLLVIHDDTLERTTSGQGPLGDHSLVGLRGMDAGDGEPIPFLEEVLALVGGQVLVNIELKGAATAEPVAACLRSFPGANVVVSSFTHDELTRFANLETPTPVAPLFGRRNSAMFDIAARLQAGSVNVSRKIVRADLIQAAHDRSLEVWVYTVNDPAEMSQFAALGVDAIFTDYPDRVPPASRARGAADTSDR